jgi:hypothetical protein
MFLDWAMEISSLVRVDYQALVEDILNEIGDCPLQELIEVLKQELPYIWRDCYKEMMPRRMDITQMQYEQFNYIYDWHTTNEPTVQTSFLPISEARLVAVIGQSQPKKTKRDDFRLRGWVGKTGVNFGKRWDKGHFIAHSIGGVVFGLEMNVYVKRRDFNRGWSEAGKRFRAMERFCVTNPGTLCFSRPIYTDQTARPAFLEFGILKPDREFLVECFDNR